MTAAAAFRADAGAQIGIGHVMRCLAIAQAWQDTGGRAIFICDGLMPGLEARLRSERIEVHQLASPSGSSEDAAETLKVASASGSAWLLVDGYHFDWRYVKRLRSDAFFIGLLDDYADRERYDVELVLNPNVFANRQMYDGCSLRGELLTGLDYALLRREFRGRRVNQVRAPELARKLLITMGGSDPGNATLELLDCLNNVVADLEVTVVSGAASPHHESLRSAALASRHPVRLLIDVHDMPGVLRCADAVISAAGGTCAELALMGVPMMLATIAPNHARNAEVYAAEELAVSLGCPENWISGGISRAIENFLRDSALRRRIASNALSRVDGEGAARVVLAMRRRAPAADVG